MDTYHKALRKRLDDRLRSYHTGGIRTEEYKMLAELQLEIRRLDSINLTRLSQINDMDELKRGAKELAEETGKRLGKSQRTLGRYIFALNEAKKSQHDAWSKGFFAGIMMNRRHLASVVNPFSDEVYKLEKNDIKIST